MSNTPIITLNGATEVTIEVGSTYIDPGASATDMSGESVEIYITSSVNENVVGEYEITYTATDASGNTSTKTRKVTVVDTTVPVITLIGDAIITLEATRHGEYIDDGATATDNLDGDIPQSVSVSGDVVNLKIPGTYRIKYNVEDDAGNKADEVIRTVTVVDTLAPIITLNGDTEVTIEVGSTYTDPGASATDISGESVEIDITSSVNENVVGEYEITYTAADASGNTTITTRKVTVVDTTVPVIILKGPSNVTVERGSPYTEQGAIAIDYPEWGSWVRQGEDIIGEAAGDQSGWSVSLSADGSIVAIGAILNNRNDENGGIISNSGHVRVYQRDSNSENNTNDTSDDFGPIGWRRLGGDIDGEAAGDQSGFSVSLSADGSIVAIGAIYNNGNGTNSGHVKVYKYDGTNWGIMGEDIDGEAADDQSGWSVSLSADGSIVAIGATYNNGNGNKSGHVRVYKYDGTNWGIMGEDIDGEAAGDQSGYSVSLSADGSIVAIGAIGNDGNGSYSGHVKVYKYDGTNWGIMGEDIDGEAAYDQSGFSVSLSADGSIVAIGAKYNNNVKGTDSGHVRVYKYDGTNWGIMGEDIDGEAAGDNSGFSVSLSADGSIVAIGARYNDGNGTTSGHVRVLELQSDQDLTINIDGDNVDTSTVNEYMLTYTATDASGNKSNEVTRTVTVTEPNIIGDSFGSPVSNTTYAIWNMNPKTDNFGKEISDIQSYQNGRYIFLESDPVVNATTYDGISIQSIYEQINTYQIPQDQDLGTNYIFFPTQTNRYGLIRDYNNQIMEVYNMALSIHGTGIEANNKRNFFLILIDTLAPIITLNGATEVTIEVGSTYTDPGASATDISGESVEIDITSSVNENVVGEYEITYTATDASGNTTRTTRKVTVRNTVLNIFNDINVDGFATPMLIDITGDGKLDLIVGNQYGKINLFINNDSTGWTWTKMVDDNNPFGDIDVGRHATPILVDLYDNEHLDLVVGNEDGKIRVWLNNGNNAWPEEASRSENPFSWINDLNDLGRNIAVALVDITGNKKLDLLVGTGVGEIRVWLNNGNNTWPEEASGDKNPFNDINVGNAATPTFADVNGNGYLDLIVGNSAGKIKVYLNLADDTWSWDNIEATRKNNPFGGIDVGKNSAPTLANITGNGYLDILIGESDGTVIGYSGKLLGLPLDTTPPVITLIGDAIITLEATQHGKYIDGGATATDNLDGDIPQSVLVSGDVVNLKIPGTYRIKYNVEDDAGNKADEVIRTVIVEHTTPPVIKLKGDAVVTHEAKTPYYDAGATAKDSFDGDLTNSIIKDQTALDITTCGDYIIRYNVSDKAGNPAVEVTRTVTVVDTTVPVIILKGPSNVTVERGSPYTEQGAIAIDYPEWGSWVRQGEDIDGEAAGDQSGWSVSLSADGSIVAIGATYNNGNDGIISSNSGHVRVYQRDSNSENNTNDTSDNFGPTGWRRLGGDIDGEAADDESGWSVSLSADGSIVAIGARYNVKVYKYDGTNWGIMGVFIIGDAAGDISGYSVSLSADGSIVAIGAPYNDGNGTYSGHVKVYKYDGTNWGIMGVAIIGEVVGDWSGLSRLSVSLSADGSIVAIGARYNDVKVYKYGGTNWGIMGVAIIGDAAGDISGYSVSLSADGSIVAIGAPYNNGTGFNSGHVKVYKYDGTNWGIMGEDIDGEAAGDLSGHSVSLSADGSIVAIGAIGNDGTGTGTNSGHVKVYKYGGTNWGIMGAAIIGEAAYDWSGHSVSLSADGSIVAIGAKYNNNVKGTDSGHVRVLELQSDQDLTINIDGDNVDTSTVNEYIITYTATDASNNKSNEVTRTVTVEDTFSPVITLKGEATIIQIINATYTDAGAIATDNLDGDISANIKITGSVDIKMPGRYTLTYNVSDAANNAATKVTRTVVIIDAEERPEITYNPDNDLLLKIDLNEINNCVTIDKTKTTSDQTFYKFNENKLDFATLVEENKLQVASAKPIRNVLSKLNIKRKAIYMALNDDMLGSWTEKLLVCDTELLPVTVQNIEDSIARGGVNAGNFNAFSTSIQVGQPDNEILNKQIQYLIQNNKNNNRNIKDGIFKDNDIFSSTNINSLQINLYESITDDIKNLFQVVDNKIVLSNTDTPDAKYVYDPQSEINIKGKIFIKCIEGLSTAIYFPISN